MLGDVLKNRPDSTRKAASHRFRQRLTSFVLAQRRRTDIVADLDNDDLNGPWFRLVSDRFDTAYNTLANGYRDYVGQPFETFTAGLGGGVSTVDTSLPLKEQRVQRKRRKVNAAQGRLLLARTLRQTQDINGRQDNQDSAG